MALKEVLALIDAEIARLEQAKSLLFGVSPTDAVTLLGAIAVVVAAGMVATLLPARRASRVQIASMMREN